ncbi:MAG: helix-turn-helix domain-containing protein [Gammaproteobacteria bacterium]|nr:helix-turn-helix domain-containing protein [Gammaproteobacteria bacterium]
MVRHLYLSIRYFRHHHLNQPIEAIANEVGYEGAGLFNRLFRRRVKLTPAQYRMRFGALHRALP